MLGRGVPNAAPLCRADALSAALLEIAVLAHARMAWFCGSPYSTFSEMAADFRVQDAMARVVTRGAFVDEDSVLEAIDASVGLFDYPRVDKKGAGGGGQSEPEAVAEEEKQEEEESKGHGECFGIHQYLI